jgi:hypothetical protein
MWKDSLRKGGDMRGREQMSSALLDLPRTVAKVRSGAHATHGYGRTTLQLIDSLRSDVWAPRSGSPRW